MNLYLYLYHYRAQVLHVVDGVVAIRHPTTWNPPPSRAAPLVTYVG